MENGAARSRGPGWLRRVGVTLLALALYRAAAWIPLPGLAAEGIGELLDQGAWRSPLGLGVASLGTASLMALGVAPLVLSALLVEALRILSPRVRRWAVTPSGARLLARGTLLGALVLAAILSISLAQNLLSVGLATAGSSAWFQAGVTVSIVAATAFAAGLAGWITRAGVGHGLWVLLLVGHTSYLAYLVQSGTPVSPEGAGSSAAALALRAFPILLLIALVAAMTLLVRARPQLSDPQELIWAPLLALTALHTVLYGAILAAARFFDPVEPELGWRISHSRPWTLFLMLAVAAIVLLRRRALADPEHPFRPARALPVIALLATGVFLAREAGHLTRGASYALDPEPLLLIAAVAVAVVVALRPTARPTPLT